jgi:hypothetical protein
MDNCYKQTTVMLIGALVAMVMFSSISKFDPLQEFQNNELVGEKYDSRYQYPYLPPVNPIVYKTERNRFSNDLELLKVPLQMNVPYDEQLRSQIISVTKYNKIKYC